MLVKHLYGERKNDDVEDKQWEWQITHDDGVDADDELMTQKIHQNTPFKQSDLGIIANWLKNGFDWMFQKAKHDFVIFVKHCAS